MRQGSVVVFRFILRQSQNRPADAKIWRKHSYFFKGGPRILELAAGNPLFVGELLRRYGDAGALADAGSPRWSGTG